MQLESLNMTKVKGIEETTAKDRSDLNVGGRSKGNKNIIIALFLLVSVVVLAAGLYFAVKNATSKPVEAPIDNNYIVGADESSLNDSDDYFEAIKKETKRKEDLKKHKAEKAKLMEAEKAKLMEAKLMEPKVVTRKNQTAKKPTPKPPQEQPKAVVPIVRKKDQTLSPEKRKMQGSVLVNTGGSQQTAKAPTTSSRNSVDIYEDGYAELRKKGSLDFLLVHGTSIPCALYTQIITDYEGFVTCRVTQDVYSMNGAALLIEKGSLVSGTQGIAMERGKARIFTSWSDIETPLGASIHINSLGTGQLGAAGIDAWIDNHFQQRFGGAILLSFIDDALGALANNIADANDVEVDNSTTNASDMASKALESSINIKPTGYAFIGQRINIMIVRDIDMSSIYRFEAEE